MSKIILGKAGGKQFSIDVKLLRRTRLLVQANSGGGKSWLLRRMAEQLFGKVPVWIIDPEGEFKSLREKFDFVLVGKGGETPADPRSAELVANKLRELRASVVFDLYDLKPPTRHHYVRVLLEAMMNAPKQLWTPVILKVDEAHMFAPEKGQGESEAFAAMQDVATRGRKRGICMAAYLQRLARLSKTVSAELLNRLVGMTFEDVDVDRAELVLSVSKSDREKFRPEIKHLHSGQFYGLGPAIAKDRTLIQVGDVLTTHPDPDDDTKLSIEPPPPTAKIKALLPKLQDLPKEAEEKAKTEAELRAENRALKAELARAKTAAKAPAPAPLPPRPAVVAAPKVIHVPIIEPKDLEQMKQVIGRLESVAKKVSAFSDLKDAVVGSAVSLGAQIDKAVRTLALQPRRMETPPVRPAPPPARPPVGTPVARRELDPVEDNGELSGPKMRILKALTFFEHLGITEVPRTWVAPIADVSHSSGGYGNNLGNLRTNGYIEYPQTGKMALTEKGRAAAGVSEPLAEEMILERCKRSVSTPKGEILQKLRDVFPDDLSRDDLALAINVAPGSGGYGNNLGGLRSAGMIVYTSPGRVRLADWVTGNVEVAVR